jgi:hypothetical protein
MLQFGLLIKNDGCGDMDGNYTHHTLTAALDQAYDLYKVGSSQLSIFTLDTETGEVGTHLNKQQLVAVMRHFEQEEIREEAEENKFGTYPEQVRRLYYATR